MITMWSDLVEVSMRPVLSLVTRPLLSAAASITVEQLR